MPKKLDLVFQALADPTRRAVLERLGERPTAVSELAARFAMSLPSFTQHLGVLAAAGLVRSKKVGRVRTCRLAPGALRAAESWLSRQRALWSRRLNQLDSYLLSLK
jgi:DNA-binding transcriptional ArsR family regulator